MLIKKGLRPFKRVRKVSVSCFTSLNGTHSLSVLSALLYGEKTILTGVLLLFSCSVLHAHWLRDENEYGKPRDDVNANNLGYDIAYITRYQPIATESKQTDNGWRCQMLYNTRYQNEARGGHLKILENGKDRPIFLVDKDNKNLDVCDFDVSYDATKIVYSQRTSVDGFWQLYEIVLDTNDYSKSSTPRVLTPPGYDSIDPSYRPDGKIVFTANSSGTLNEYEEQLNELLHIMDPNPASGQPSNTIRQISFFPSGDYNPMILNDGRLLWMRYEHHGVQDYFPLMVSRPDGTFVEEMFGFKFQQRNLERNTNNNIRVFNEFTQLPEPDGRIIATTMWHFWTYEAGGLALIDPRRGPTDFRMPHILTPEISVSSHPSPVGRLRTPCAYKDKNGESRILASYSHGPVCASKITGKTTKAYQYTPDFGIWTLKWNGTGSKALTLEPDKEIVNTKQEADIDPQPILPQKKPPVIPSYYLEGEESGEFLCLDVNENSLINRAFEYEKKGGSYFRVNKADTKWESNYGNYAKVDLGPVNGKLASDATTVKKVRVLAGLPVNVMGNTFRRLAFSYHEPKRILGEVDVKGDGSFRVRVPVKTPIHFQTLNNKGQVISSMRSWVYLNPTHKKMQTRVCIGCHERRGHTVPGGSKMALAAKEPAKNLYAEVKDDKYTDYEMYHFVRDIYPIIRKYCLKCHNNKKRDKDGRVTNLFTYQAPAGNIDLSDDISPIYNVAYDALFPWVRTDNAVRKSELLRMLTRARLVNDCGMPRAPRNQCNEKELVTPLDDNGEQTEMDANDWKTLVKWMEMGALFRFYGDGQVQTPLPGQYNSAYKNAFGTPFENNCTTCHGASYTRSQKHPDIESYVADFVAQFQPYGSGPNVPGEYSMNMSFPRRSRLLKAPDGSDLGVNSRANCPGKDYGLRNKWKAGNSEYDSMFEAIKDAQEQFIGDTAELGNQMQEESLLKNACITACHKEGVARGVAPTSYSELMEISDKNSSAWKLTIMKMGMYVHRYGMNPEREENALSDRRREKGNSLRPPEAALVHRILTSEDSVYNGKTALEFYKEAREKRYENGSNYTKDDIDEAQKLLWSALQQSPTSNLEKLIRLELGVLFMQYPSEELENNLYKEMKQSRPKIRTNRF